MPGVAEVVDRVKIRVRVRFVRARTAAARVEAARVEAGKAVPDRAAAARVEEVRPTALAWERIVTVHKLEPIRVKVRSSKRKVRQVVVGDVDRGGVAVPMSVDRAETASGRNGWIVPMSLRKKRPRWKSACRRSST